MPTTSVMMTARADGGHSFGMGLECEDSSLFLTAAQGIGVGQVGPNDLVPGLRFPNVQVPTGTVVIKSAKIAAYVNTISGGGATADFYADAVDDAPGWANDNRPHCITRESPGNRVSLQPVGAIDIDVTAQVQRLVDRPGWRSGNAMRFAAFHITPGASTFLDHAEDLNPPELEIVYEVVSAEAPSLTPDTPHATGSTPDTPTAPGTSPDTPRATSSTPDTPTAPGTTPDTPEARAET